MVKVKAVNGRIGRVKTEYSEDELPIDPQFARVLKAWKKKCPASPGGWVFPSPFTDRCYHASPIQQDYIRPAGRKLGLESVGWHTFRHTYRTWLDATGAPVGVQQKLLRHADVGTTMKYGNALMESKRDANSKVVRMARPLLQQARAYLGNAVRGIEKGLLAAALFSRLRVRFCYWTFLDLRSERLKLATY